MCDEYTWHHKNMPISTTVLTLGNKVVFYSTPRLPVCLVRLLLDHTRFVSLQRVVAAFSNAPVACSMIIVYWIYSPQMWFPTWRAFREMIPIPSGQLA